MAPARPLTPLAHAKQREAFGQPIANYQAIQWMLADSATELTLPGMLMLKRRRALRQKRPTLEAAMVASASEAAHRAADRAMQILASHGYQRSVVERFFATSARRRFTRARLKRSVVIAYYILVDLEIYHLGI